MSRPVLRPWQRAGLLFAICGVSFAALLLASWIEQKMAGETLAWCLLLFILALMFVIVDVRPGRGLLLLSGMAAAFAFLAPLSVLSRHISPSFAYANINTLGPLGLWGLLGMVAAGLAASARVWFRRRSGG